MASFSIYKLINEQGSLTYRESNGMLNLKSMANDMEDEHAAAVKNNEITSEGFLNTKLHTVKFVQDESSAESMQEDFSTADENVKTEFVIIDSPDYIDFWKHILEFSQNHMDPIPQTLPTEIKYIQTAVAAEGSLGYFEKAFLTRDGIINQRDNFTFYSSTDVMIFENGLVITFFKNSAIESIKTPVRNLIERLGFENNIKPFKLNSNILKSLKESLDWTKAKLERIENEGDNTKTVSYEVDMAGDQSNSKIDQIYSDKGDFVSLTCNIHYDYIQDEDIKNRSFLINFYQAEDKISWQNSLFGCKLQGPCNIPEMLRFTRYVTNLLLGYARN